MRHINTTATAVEKMKARAKIISKLENISNGKALIMAAKESGYDHWHHVVCCHKMTSDNNIPYYTDYRYTYVSSRDGWWIPGRGPVKEGFALSDRLEDRYEEWSWVEESQSWSFSCGDPRRFMGWNETSFLVVLDGQFGVLSELETCFVEADDSDYQIQDNETGNEYVSKEKFEGYKRTYWNSIEGLRKEFNKTIFFLCANDVEDRLTVCAFTPLVETSDGYYDSPYANEGVLHDLDNSLGEIIFG